MSPMFALFGQKGDWLPQGSSMAGRVDSIICGLLVAGTAVFVVLSVLTVFILIRYRRGSSASRTPVKIPTWVIETSWSVATLAVFLYFFVRGAGVYIAMERIPPGAEMIHVVARQWMWDMRYGDGRREFNTLHLRQGSPARLLLSSEDVIHSFFVPAFRLKQDAVPGRVVSTWVTPTRTGTYTLFCAQYCGTAHAEMTGTVVVLAPAEYDAWKQGARPENADVGGAQASRGRIAYMKYGCARCHEDPLAQRAPSLAGLYGNRVRLSGGHTALADEQFLHDCILLAPKYVIAGYPAGMPTYAGIMSESDAVDLIAYIESLPAPTGSLASVP